MTLRELARQVATRQRSALDITRETLARIEARNPELNAFLCLNPRAEAEARAADRAVAAGRPLGPLHGVPISLKDLILTRDMPTTAGSRTFGDGIRADADAPVVRRLRRAGAVILGKTNLHELAMGVTTVNEHFGPARNPHDLARVPGGSSGGSAAAVAAGLGLGSVGSDTRGSIRIPAACCGIVGLKPTYGLVATEGVVPLSPSLDHLGPMATTVADAALMLGAMAGTRSRAAGWLAAAEGPAPPRLTIGVCDWWLADLDPGVEAAVRDAIETLAAGGFAVRELRIEGLPEAHAASGVITGAEALAFHQQRLESNPDGIGPRVRARMQKAYALTAVDYVRAEEAQAFVMASLGAAFREVDVIAGATLPALPPRLDEHTVRIGPNEVPVLEAFTRLNAVANMAGIPALSLPCARRAGGLPVGLQLLAAPGREEALLALGGWYERSRTP